MAFHLSERPITDYGFDEGDGPEFEITEDDCSDEFEMGETQ